MIRGGVGAMGKHQGEEEDKRSVPLPAALYKIHPRFEVLVIRMPGVIPLCRPIEEIVTPPFRVAMYRFRPVSPSPSVFKDMGREGNSFPGKEIIFPVDPDFITGILEILKKIMFPGFQKIPEGPVSGGMNILSGKETAPGRGTYRVLYVALFKNNSLSGQAFIVRGIYFCIAIDAQGFCPQFIGKKKNIIHNDNSSSRVKGNGG
jgi:hypothetical protein